MRKEWERARHFALNIMGTDKELYLCIGERVRQARDAAGLTQSDLAERVCLTRTSITNIERARQSVQLHTLYAIAEALEVSVHALLPQRLELARAEPMQNRLERVLEDKTPRLKPEERDYVRSLLSGSLGSAETKNADTQKST